MIAGREQPRPCSGEPGRRDRRRLPARWAAGVEIASARWLGATIEVDRSRMVAKRVSTLAEGQVLDVEAVPAVGSATTSSRPLGREPTALRCPARRGELEGAARSRAPRSRSRPARPRRDRRAARCARARRARRGRGRLHLVERGLVRRADEDRVGVAVGATGRARQRMPYRASTAPPPNGSWTSSRRSGCRRATSASTRQASPISSGPTPRRPGRPPSMSLSWSSIAGCSDVRSGHVVETHLSCCEVGVCGVCGRVRQRSP